MKRVGELFDGKDASQAFMDASGLSEDDWDTIHNLDAPENAATVTFDQLFKVYRGYAFADELEDVGNASAKECNRSRAILSGAFLFSNAFTNHTLSLLISCSFFSWPLNFSLERFIVCELF